MIRFILITTLFFAALNARENPFLPSTGEKDIPYTSNEDRTIPPLKSAVIKLPAQARVLKKVTLEYKNLDGSIESTSLELDSSVDWHLPIFVSQNNSEAQLPVAAKEKESFKEAKDSYKSIASIKYLNFLSSGKRLKIITDDKIKRNFLLVNPHRIVIDFNKDEFVKSYIKDIPDSIFTKIRIGSHDGYYRAVVELDGHYRYEMKEISNGYQIELR